MIAPMMGKDNEEHAWLMARSLSQISYLFSVTSVQHLMKLAWIQMERAPESLSVRHSVFRLSLQNEPPESSRYV